MVSCSQRAQNLNDDNDNENKIVKMSILPFRSQVEQLGGMEPLFQDLWRKTSAEAELPEIKADTLCWTPLRSAEMLPVTLSRCWGASWVKILKGKGEQG